MKTRFSYIVMLLVITGICAQDNMEGGFQLLETGNFEAAESFFDSYLESHPGNRTAQICYGRAVGLSGEPKKSIAIFTELREEYPEDLEVQINYNESFLWDNQFEAAKPLYVALVQSYPQNFGALLGLANTLSNLKEYKAATEWVNKALLLKPKNESAKISRKYILLGYANEFVNKQEYEYGKNLLEEVFIDFPEDKDALLNLANLYLITKNIDSAKITYQRLATSPKDSITALNGIALAEHIGGNDKESLRIADIAKSKLIRFNDTLLTKKTLDRYVHALIWNRKFKAAKHQIDSLEKRYPNQNWIITLMASLGMYTGDFKNSLSNYNALLEKDSTSFDGNLGKANALFASDRPLAAYRAAYKTLDIYENQIDAEGFIAKLNAIYNPAIEVQSVYTFDNGNNTAFTTTASSGLPLSTKFVTTISYQNRTTENSVTLNKANSNILLVGIHYKLLPKVNIKTVFGLNNSRIMETSYTQPVMDFRLQLQPLKLQNLELGYLREIQNFNADLIEREIVMNHYGLNYNLGTNFNLGWYSQLMYTQQTDNNSRNLLFSSLYYNVLRKPAFKVGANYQFISFKEQVPDIYFSPAAYHAFELFTDIRGTISKKTNYMFSGAAGYQKVEKDKPTPTFRAEGFLQHQFSKRFSAFLYGKYSNIASATASGFEFTELGMRLRWSLSKKPLFQKKI